MDDEIYDRIYQMRIHLTTCQLIDLAHEYARRTHCPMCGMPRNPMLMENISVFDPEYILLDNNHIDNCPYWELRKVYETHMHRLG